MIGGGFGAPGQRESIKGGRDQDLLTPVWQTVALCFCGVWIIGWLAATAMVMGAMLGYVLSLAVFVVRWGRKIARDWETEYTYTSYAAYFGWILLNLTIHICIGYGGDLIWTSYVMPWSPWQKLWFVLISVAMSVPFGVLGYVLIVRLFDPNYPSPRKAVDQRQPQMPWYLDAPVDGTELITAIPEIDLSAMVTNGQTSTRTRVRLPVGAIRHWRSFCIAYTRGDCRFSGNAAEGFGVDRALFDRIVDKWASPDPQMALIDPASVGPRKTLEPTNKGNGMIAVFASTPLDELSALLAPYETDRQ